MNGNVVHVQLDFYVVPVYSFHNIVSDTGKRDLLPKGGTNINV